MVKAKALTVSNQIVFVLGDAFPEIYIPHLFHQFLVPLIQSLLLFDPFHILQTQLRTFDLCLCVSCMYMQFVCRFVVYLPVSGCVHVCVCVGLSECVCVLGSQNVDRKSTRLNSSH